MKKGVIIVLAVAILGAVGVYAKKHDSSTASVVASAGSSNNSSTSAGSNSLATYKDGTFTGSSAETPYGTVKVAAVISGGKITDINFINMPKDEARSQQITADSKPLLKQAAINTQGANIDFVSGATSTSFGYKESLQAALDNARQS
jgi:uncharacterized protein with FMN-binding domain